MNKAVFDQISVSHISLKHSRTELLDDFPLVEYRVEIFRQSNRIFLNCQLSPSYFSLGLPLGGRFLLNRFQPGTSALINLR